MSLIELLNANREIGKQIIDSLPTAIYITDAEGRLTYYNSAAVEFSGQEPEIGAGQWCITWKLYHPDGTPMPHEECPMAVSLKEDRSINGAEAIAELPNGERRWFKAYPSPLHNDDGEIIGVVNMLIDTSDQKKWEHSHRDFEGRYKTLVKSFPKGAVALFDQNLQYTAVGGEFVDEIGINPEERIGNKITDIYPDEIVSEVESYFQAALDGEESSFEIDFHNRHLFAHTVPIRDKEGGVTSGMLVVQDITERWQAQQELRESEAKFRILAENLNEVIWMASADAEEFIYINPAFEEIWGMNREKLYDESLSFLERVHPEDRERVREKYTALPEKEVEVIFRIIQPDGEIRWIHARAFETHHKEGGITRVIGISEDITEQKENERELRRSEEKYRTLFETMDEGLCILKIIFDENDNPTDWHYLEANSAFEEHTGLENIKGELASEVLPHLEENWFEKYGRIALTGKPAHFQDYTGELDRWFEISAFRIGEPHERKVAVLFNNITERKQAQEEREKLLREVKTERERLSEIFKQAPSFMCIQSGPDHVYERANDLYRKLIGDREIIGKPVREAFPDLEGQGYFELLDRVYETGEPFIGTDMKVMLQDPNSGKDPEERFLDFVYQPLRGPDGSVNGIFTQGVDLTERKEAKEELKAMNETLEERVEKRTKKLRSYQQQLRSLASQLNKAEEKERQRLATELHDKLGQMLAIAKMRAEGLQHTELSDQRSNDIEELKQLIDDTLKYSQNLMVELKPPPVLDKEDVTEVLYWTAKQVEKQDLNINIEDDGQHKGVDKELRTILHQSVRELLQNVLKHANSNEAWITISREQGNAKVIVEDKGKGFDLNKNVHEPGGFGLFNIKERMDWHGGNFQIDSEPGKGTKAILRAPLKEKGEKNAEEEILPPSEKEELQKEVQQKIKILLVDDHEMMRRGLRQMIEKQDDLMVSAEASDGKEAVELAHEISPHIIIMDVNMPVMNGIEATQKIKSELPDMRIIGLSLHESREVVNDMKNAGASEYLTKSEAFESLIATIRAETSSLEV